MNNIIKIVLIGLFLSSIGCRHKSSDNKRIRHSTIVTSNQEIKRTHTNNSPIDQRHSDKKLDGTEIFRRYETAVFMIFTSDGQQNFQGSGFFINKNGLAVSNYHIFKGTTIGREQIKLSNDNTIYNVTEIIYKNNDEDFIIFRVNCNNTNYIPIASSKPQIGEKVYAIGSPRGLENTFSSGEISQWRDINLMQISALIDHGSSGGALINEYGEAVGITSGSFADGSQANLNYAWSINVIKPYIK